MVDLLICGCAGAAVALGAADRVVKARARARQRREMSRRLATAAARAEEQRRHRQAEVTASAALTSVMPAISRPPLSTEAGPGQRGGDQPRSGGE